MKINIIIPTSNCSTANQLDSTVQPIMEGAVIAASALSNKVDADIICYDLRFIHSYAEHVFLNIGKNDIVCISGIVDGYKFIKDFSKKLKTEKPDVTIIVGGHLVMTSAEVLLKQTDVDICLFGPSESSLPLLIRALMDDNSFGHLPVAFKTDDGELKINRTNLQSFTVDYSRLSEYNFNLWDSDIFDIKKMTNIAYSTQRGCPYSCTFCANTSGRQVQHVALEKVNSDLREFKNKYNIENIIINDPTFNSNRKRAIKISETLGRFEMSWSCSIRVGKDPFSLYSKMKENGCTTAFIGIESFDQNILDKSNKQIHIKNIINCLETSEKVGLNLVSFLILGLPGETQKSLESIIEIYDQYDLIPRAFFAAPYPGSKLFLRYCSEQSRRGLDPLDVHEKILLKMSDDKLDGTDQPFEFERVDVTTDDLISVMAKINKQHLSRIKKTA